MEAYNRSLEVFAIVPGGSETGAASLTTKALQHNSRLRVIHHPDGEAVIVGDCFAQDAELSHLLGEARTSSDVSKLCSLPGNFGVLATSRSGLTAISSLSGDHTWYYGRASDGQMVVDSQPILPGVKSTPDKSYLTAHVALRGVEAALPGSSGFTNVAKLADGHILRVSSGQTTIEPYVNLLQDWRHAALSFEEAAEQLKEALIHAIQARINASKAESPPLSTDFSGGLDSTSLAFLARRAQGSGVPLPIFFANPPNPEAGDMVHIRRYLDFDDQLQPHRFTDVPETARYTYESALELPIPPDLEHANKLSPREIQYLGAYNAFIESVRGAGIHLTGDGGDEVVGGNRGFLADSMRHGDLKRLWHDGLGYARLLNVSPMRVGKITAQLAFSGIPGALRQAAHSLELSSFEDDYDPSFLVSLMQPAGPSGTWLTKRARLELAEALDHRATLLRADRHRMNLGDFIAITGLHAAGQMAAATRHCTYASGSQLSLHMPFLDAGVIRAAFAVSAAAKSSPHESKRLLRRALAGAVPDEVLARQSKGAYDGLQARSAIQSLPAIHSLLTNPHLAELGIIEPSAVHSTLARIHTASSLELWSLERVICAELWLRRLNANNVFTSMPLDNNRPSIVISSSIPRSTAPTGLPTPQSPNPPAPQEGYVAVPAYVHALASPAGALVFFNEWTDRYHPLDRTRSDVARALVNAGSVEQAAHLMATRYPSTDPALIRSDVAQCYQELHQLGLLEIMSEQHTPPLPTTSAQPRLALEDGVTSRSPSADIKIRFQDRLIAASALTIGGLAIRFMVPRHRLPFLRAVQARLCHREATPDEAAYTVQMLHSVPYIGRLACLEGTYVVALTNAFLGRRVAFHQGASFEPLGYHAWIEAQGQPITSPYDGRVTGLFQSFFTKA